MFYQNTSGSAFAAEDLNHMNAWWQCRRGMPLEVNEVLVVIDEVALFVEKLL